MLRSDGTLALGVAVAVPPPPHAVTNRPAANRAGAKRASFMRTYLSDQFSRCLLPDLAFGARVRRQRVLLRPWAGRHCVAIPKRCQVSRISVFVLTWRAYHRLVSGKRIVWIVPAFGLIGSQAGHLLAYELRFGNAAQQVQSAGAHSYFPSLAKTGLGVAALTLLVALLIVGAGRVATGRRIKPEAAPSFVPLVAALYTH